MLVRDLEDGFDIDQVLLVREADCRQKRDGGTWSTHYTVVSIETVYSTDGLDPATHPKPGDAR